MLESDVSRLIQPALRRRNRERSGDISHSQCASNDGIARIVVHGIGPESSEVNADGLRSSTTRAAVFFNSYFLT